MIATIIGWVIKALIGGLFKLGTDKAIEKAKKERDAATIAATTAREVNTLEVEILKKQREAEKAFKAKPPPEDDPFNFKAWNAGEL